MSKDWVTICMIYPEELCRELDGEGEVAFACVRELMGGPLDGLIVETGPDEIVWSVPVLTPAKDLGLTFPVKKRWGAHVYAKRRDDPDRMFYSGFMPLGDLGQ